MGIKKKKGFTLLELTIVIALTAIIVTMVISFVAVYRTSTYSLKGNDDYMTNLTTLQLDIENLLSRYDSNYYDLKIENGVIKVTHSSKGSTLSSLQPETTISYDPNNKQLLDSATGTVYSYPNITSVLFSYGKKLAEEEDGSYSLSSSDDERLIYCTVSDSEGNEVQFIYSRQSKTTRNRYSSNKRTDAAKIQLATDNFLSTYTTYYKNLITTEGKLTTDNTVLQSARPYLYFADGKLNWDRTFGLRHKYYSLSSTSAVNYSINDKTLTCTITYADSTKETLTWDIGWGETWN